LAVTGIMIGVALQLNVLLFKEDLFRQASTSS